MLARIVLILSPWEIPHPSGTDGGARDNVMSALPAASGLHRAKENPRKSAKSLLLKDGAFTVEHTLEGYSSV